MLRRAVQLTVLLVFWVQPLSVFGQTPDTGPGRPSLSLDLFKLAKRVDFKGFNGSKKTLREALEELVDQYDLPLVLDHRAFRQQGVRDVEETNVLQKPIPRMPNASLASVLRTLLSRIPARGKATYIIRQDYIEITTQPVVLAEFRERRRDLKMKSKKVAKSTALALMTLSDFPLDELMDLLQDVADLQILVDTQLSMAGLASGVTEKE